MSFEDTQSKIKIFLKNADDNFNHILYFSSSILKNIVDYIPKELDFNNKNIIELGIGGGYLASYLFNNYKIKKYIGLDANFKSLNISYQKLLFWKKKIQLFELKNKKDYDFSKYNIENSIFLSFVCIQQFPNENYTKIFFQNLNNSGINELFFQVRENIENNEVIFKNDFDNNFKFNNYLTIEWILNKLENYTLVTSIRTNQKNQYLFLYFKLKTNNEIIIFNTQTNNNDKTNIVETNDNKNNNDENTNIVKNNNDDKTNIVKNNNDETTNIVKNNNDDKTNNDEIRIEDLDLKNKKEDVIKIEEIKYENVDDRLKDYFSFPFINYSFTNSKNKFEKFMKVSHFICQSRPLFYNQGRSPLSHIKLIGKLDVPILVIGNSPQVKEYELGDIIDKFPIVIRINDWITKGFEKHIGKKTDIWISCASMNAQVIKRKADTYKKLITILGSTRMDLFEKLKLAKTRLRINKIDGMFHNDSIIFGYNNIGGKNCLTTGSLIMLLLCCLGYQKIFYHGINLDYRGRNQRYFSNKALSAPHNMGMERDFLNFLVNNCSLKNLSELFPDKKVEKKDEE